MANLTTPTLSVGNNSGSIREDLADFISNIDRDETPVMSSIGSTSASQINHEWLVDDYNDPVFNAQSENFAFDSSVTGNPATQLGAVAAGRTRIGNYTQIFGKQIHVSGSSISSDTAAVANEYAYQLKKRGVELRRDKEAQILRYNNNAVVTTSTDNNQGVKSGGGQLVTRRFGSLFSFAGNHSVIGLTGTNTAYIDNNSAATGNNVAVGGNLPAAADSANANFVTPDGTRTIATTGTSSAITRDRIEDLLTTMHLNGGKPTMAVSAAAGKVAISRLFGSDTTTNTADIRRLESMEKKLNLAITAVMTDFGYDIGFMPNYIMDRFSGADSEVVFYDPSMVKSAVLTPMTTEEDRTARYGRAGIIYDECSIEVKNPFSVGVVYNADFS